MLNQQPEDTTSNDNMSVTSREMASAIAAIEKRKTEQAERLTGTAQVQRVVQELGIDASPDEVLDEVRRQRLAAAEAQRLKVSPTPRLQPQSKLDQPQGASRNKPRRYGLWSIVAAVTLGWWLMQGPLHTGNPLASVGVPSSTTLAEVPNEDVVTVDTPTLVKLLKGASPTSIYIDEPNQQNMWWLVKHGGNLYIEAWVPTKVTPEAALAAPFTLYNDAQNTPGDDQDKITVPLSGVHLDSDLDRGVQSTVTLSNVHLDSRAWDDYDGI